MIFIQNFCGKPPRGKIDRFCSASRIFRYFFQKKILPAVTVSHLPSILQNLNQVANTKTFPKDTQGYCQYFKLTCTFLENLFYSIKCGKDQINHIQDNSTYISCGNAEKWNSINQVFYYLVFWLLLVLLNVSSIKIFWKFRANSNFKGLVLLLLLPWAVISPWLYYSDLDHSQLSILNAYAYFSFIPSIFILAIIAKFYRRTKNTQNFQPESHFYFRANLLQINLLQGVIISPILAIGKIHLLLLHGWSKFSSSHAILLSLAIAANLLQIIFSFIEYTLHQSRYANPQHFKNVCYTQPATKIDLGLITKYFTLPKFILQSIFLDKYLAIVVIINLIEIYRESKNLEVLFWIIFYLVLHFLASFILGHEANERLEDIRLIEQEEAETSEKVTENQKSSSLLNHRWVRFGNEWLGLATLFQAIDIYRTKARNGLVSYKLSLFYQLKGLYGMHITSKICPWQKFL